MCLNLNTQEKTHRNPKGIAQYTATDVQDLTQYGLLVLLRRAVTKVTTQVSDRE